MNNSTFLQLLFRLFMLKEIQKHLLPLFLLADCQIEGWTEPQTFIKFCDIQNTKLASISAWNWLFPSDPGVLGFALFGCGFLRLCLLKSWFASVESGQTKGHLHQKGDIHVINMQHLTQCNVDMWLLHRPIYPCQKSEGVWVTISCLFSFPFSLVSAPKLAPNPHSRWLCPQLKKMN